MMCELYIYSIIRLICLSKSLLSGEIFVMMSIWCSLGEGVSLVRASGLAGHGLPTSAMQTELA